MQDAEIMVTIGLPFFNNENTLNYTLKSIFNQTNQNWKLILINDGSTDNSCACISEEILTDSRVQFINDKNNRGLVYRLNQIADLCDTRYLARMDSDDLMMPERIEIQLKYLIEHPEVDLLDSGMYSIDEHYNPFGVRGLCPIAREAKSIILKPALNHATIMGKSEWFKSNKYDPAYLRAEDYELWCRTYASSNFERILLPLYIVREGNVNVKNYALSMKTCRKILNTYGPDFLSKTEFQSAILKTYIKTILYNFFGIFRLQHTISKKRNCELTKNEEIRLKNVLFNILNL